MYTPSIVADAFLQCCDGSTADLLIPVDLLGDVWLLGFFFAMVAALIGRERVPAAIGWFPDRSGAIEDKWFDYMIRIPDWFAGAVASWDIENDLVPVKHAKYPTDA